ncbi:MAG: zinc ribbon domain-containing protein [Acidobacteria bacterium]|nr:zinc ribbon domain-containing protein [Acidobacteriota bacterium]
MPLYEYRCAKCERVFEVIQKFSDTPLSTHEGCGGGVERLISAPAFQFKGSGWYITDYARSGKGGDKKAEGSDAKPAEGKSAETKSEPKGDSKPETKAPAPAST